MRKVAFMTLVGCLIAVFVVAGFSVSFAAPNELRPAPVNPKILYKPRRIPIPLRPCDGPDPGVVSLRVTKSIVVRNGVKIGVLRITSTLKNVGAQDFVPRPGQQALLDMLQCNSMEGPEANRNLGSKDGLLGAKPRS